MADLRSFFQSHLAPGEGPYKERQLYEIRYAAAALMIALAKADDEEDPDEEEVIMQILRETFDLSDDALNQLIRLADMDTNTDKLAALTDLVNEHYRDADKLILLENLWRVANADGRVDRFEDQFIRRVAQLVGLGEDDIRSAQQASLA